MNVAIPELNQFALEELGQTPSVDNPNAEVSFKVDIEPVRVTRHPDRLSPLLLHAAASGAAWPTVTLRVTDDDGPCWQVTLTDVLVISVLSSLEESGPLETVDLSYGAVTWAWLRDDQPSRTWVVFKDRP